jgi:hypothetical protein
MLHIYHVIYTEVQCCMFLFIQCIMFCYTNITPIITYYLNIWCHLCLYPSKCSFPSVPSYLYFLGLINQAIILWWIWRCLCNDLPNCAMHQMWSLLLNGRVWTWCLLRNNFPEYTVLQMWSLLLNGYNQSAYFSGNKYTGLTNRGRIVEFPQKRDMLTNVVSKIKRTLGQGVLYPVLKIYLSG